VGAINRVPSGLLSLLDGQNLGDNPSELAQVIQPTLDLFHFFTASRGLSLELVTESFLAAAVGFKAILQVPMGELWIVEAFSGQIQAAAPGNSYWSPALAVASNPAAPVIPLWTGAGVSVPSQMPYIKQATLPNELFLPPGTQLGCYLWDTTAIALGFTVTTQVLCQKFRV
jgi:hypothetical protein